MTVRLIDADEFPKHGGDPWDKSAVPFGNWQDWRGKEIEVDNGPHSPKTCWTCGTKSVYRVPQHEVKRIHGDHQRGRVFVCEHQIILPEGA